MAKTKKVAATYNFEGFNEKDDYIKEEREIYVGMPCTYGVGSDAYPAHVSRISDSGKNVWIKAADWKADIEGGHEYFGNQKYIITPNDNMPEERVTKNKYGQWKLSKYSSVYFGHARKYEDPTF